ncbi:MAG: DNA topoisomerase 3 [Solirubrobacterales bacterium]|nr:DNA topoisomerase 3 [Solirubrobacterales bacterium]
MAKTLVIAEKPSVGRDLARVLPGPFQKQEGYLEAADHVITWAVGHLVQLAGPDEYDPKFKKWKMADLPIVPEKFKLVVRDERSKKQMSVVTRQLGRDDVETVVNACDAGREGELIFAYLFEKAASKKPVQRLWLSSMTKDAMNRAFGELRPGADLAELEAAARSRSEADWIVGMNATRAATIRLRSSFDGAVSLGRVQTPTLAIITRREEEIRAFKPEPYWLVDAVFAAGGDRVYEGRFHAGAKPRIATAAEADAIVAVVRDQTGEITKLETKEKRERAPLLYDLTSLQREANTRFGFSARRTLAAAQRCYEEHKVLTYPRTSSRYLTSDMVAEIKPTAGHVGGAGREYQQGAAYVQGLDLLPLGRVIADDKVGDHHAIIPTNSPHHLDKLSDDDRRIYDLAARRFLAVFHPEAVFENTRVETTVSEHVFRTRGKVLLVPGWRGVYGELAEGEGAADEDEGRDQQLPKLASGEAVQTREVGAEEKETKPPRRYSDASLLGAMETAGKLVDDDEMREAMKESGIGTPATRASIIERLIDVGYIERDGRSLVATEKGLNVIRLLGEHPLTSPSLTGDWEQRLGMIERGEEPRDRFMADIGRFAQSTVAELDAKLKDVRIPRENLGPCPVCGHDIIENRKGFSCWSREDPGCGFVIWKAKAGKQLPLAVARELIATGRTAKQVTGFKGRSGRSFRARLALQQSEEGKWRVEFDEPWAKEGAKPPESEEAAEATRAADAAAPAAATATRQLRRSRWKARAARPQHRPGRARSCRPPAPTAHRTPPAICPPRSAAAQASHGTSVRCVP